MTRLVVCDASALVALLLDNGPSGQWATRQLRDAVLVAPSLLRYEVASIICSQELAGLVSTDQAAQAYADLVDLALEEWPYDAVAARVWELRHNVTCYDAAYVAVAELVDAPLVTLDRRIDRALGLRCVVSVP